MSSLVVYFSRGGSTAKSAKKLAEAVGADIFEVKTESKQYGGYFKALGIASKEYKADETVETVGDVENFDSYDTVFVGFPIWYGKCPQIMASFLKAHNFEGKDVYPFCRSGMSKIDGAMPRIEECCAGAKVHPGLRMKGGTKKEDIDAWIKG